MRMMGPHPSMAAPVRAPSLPVLVPPRPSLPVLVSSRPCQAGQECSTVVQSIIQRTSTILLYSSSPPPGTQPGTLKPLPPFAANDRTEHREGGQLFFLVLVQHTHTQSSLTQLIQNVQNVQYNTVPSCQHGSTISPPRPFSGHSLVLFCLPFSSGIQQRHPSIS